LGKQSQPLEPGKPGAESSQFTRVCPAGQLAGQPASRLEPELEELVVNPEPVDPEPVAPELLEVALLPPLPSLLAALPQAASATRVSVAMIEARIITRGAQTHLACRAECPSLQASAHRAAAQHDTMERWP
jgi:hypothetical protein